MTLADEQVRDEALRNLAALLREILQELEMADLLPSESSFLADFWERADQWLAISDTVPRP